MAEKRRRLPKEAPHSRCRFVVYLPTERYRLLKSKLMAEGLTITDWGRQMADAKIDGAP